AGLGVYLFLVHMLTAKSPFIPREVFKDRNYLSAMVLMFVTGAIMVASSALLPPYLQNLGGYSVAETGILIAPRGFGTMVGMMFAGRMALKIDPRYLMALGTAMVTWSMWEMSGWTPAVSPWSLTWVTFLQGIGMGFIFVPMNLIAFATMPQYLRTDGSAVMNL